MLEVVADERSSAIALYERTGWRRVDTYPADWTTPDGAPVSLHHYALQDRSVPMPGVASAGRLTR